jgi:hypothetical protein
MSLSQVLPQIKTVKKEGTYRHRTGKSEWYVHVNATKPPDTDIPTGTRPPSYDTLTTQRVSNSDTCALRSIGTDLSIWDIHTHFPTRLLVNHG